MAVREGRTIAEIAEAVGVSKTTVGRWSKAGDWADKRRRRQAENPDAGLDKLKETRRNILESWPAKPDPAEVDALYKLDLLITREEERHGGPSEALRVMEAFAAFVAASLAADDAAIVARAVEDYLTEVRRRTRG